MAHGICWEPPIRLWREAQPCSLRRFGSYEGIAGSHQLSCGVCPASGIESWRLGTFGEDPPTYGVCFILVKVLVVNLNENIVTIASPHR